MSVQKYIHKNTSTVVCDLVETVTCCCFCYVNVVVPSDITLGLREFGVFQTLTCMQHWVCSLALACSSTFHIARTCMLFHFFLRSLFSQLFCYYKQIYFFPSLLCVVFSSFLVLVTMFVFQSKLFFQTPGKFLNPKRLKR